MLAKDVMKSASSLKELRNSYTMGTIQMMPSAIMKMRAMVLAFLL